MSQTTVNSPMDAVNGSIGNCICTIIFQSKTDALMRLRCKTGTDINLDVINIGKPVNTSIMVNGSIINNAMKPTMQIMLIRGQLECQAGLKRSL